MTVALVMIAALAIIHLLFTYQIGLNVVHFGGLFTFLQTVKAVGWLLPLIATIACILSLYIANSPMPENSPFLNLTPQGALSVIIPLLMGTHVAASFGIEDEPALELLLIYKRPFIWVILERAYLLVAFYAAIGVVTAIIGMSIKYEGSFLATTSYWFCPALVLTGVGLRISLAARHIVFGIVSVLMLWGVLGFFSYLIAQFAVSFWPVFLYPPQGILSEQQYIINRVLLTFLGSTLIIWASVTLTDRELLLTGKKG